MKFRFYSDPSHGWLAVKKDTLKLLNIENKITICSYQKGRTVYLEEDYDMTLFIEEFKKFFGTSTELIFIEKHVDKYSIIRHYDNYRGNYEK